MSIDGTLEPLPPGSVVGILGGGQLGRMLAMAAARLGIRCHVYRPGDERPAAQVAETTTVAAYEDTAALDAFAAAVDVVTYEFENVPSETAAYLDERVPVRPSPEALGVCQDRLREKRFLADAGVATARFAEVDSLAALEDAVARIVPPAVLKTRRFGYDGKGQAFLRRAEDAEDAWTAIAGQPAILESFVAFDREISVIVARGLDGETAAYDPARNVHEHHILAHSIVPAGIADALAREANRLAERVVTRLDYVGVMGVEMFVTAAGEPRLLVNELAPRVHNSGHWTLDACAVSQFEQHIRAICGWPLASPARHHDAVMDNLLGDAAGRWQDLAAAADTALHLYGKREMTAGRKMGHVTRLYPLGHGHERRGDGDARIAPGLGGDERAIWRKGIT